MNEAMGEYGTFWFYMCWCIAGLFFVYFFLPETKGKSFEEIERMFSSKKQVDVHHGAVGPIEEVKSHEVVTVESMTSKISHSNNGYQYDSDEDDSDDVVPTPV